MKARALPKPTPPAGPTDADCARALRSIRPGTLDNALGCAIRDIYSQFFDASVSVHGVKTNLEGLYHDLLGAAELARVFLLVERPDVHARLGEGGGA